MAFRPPCEPLGGLQALRRTMVECDRGRLATISHDCSFSSNFTLAVLVPSI